MTVRPYPCPCGKRFRSHAELVRHQRECRAAGGGTVVRRTA